MEIGKKLIPKRHTTEWVIIFLTFVLVIITLSTFILDQKKSNWVCGPVLILLELIAIGLQVAFIVTIWSTQRQKIKTIFTIISFAILTFIAWNFINFLTNCS